jgi:hypothetical protein
MKTEQLIAKGVKHHFNGQESIYVSRVYVNILNGLQITNLIFLL